MKCSNCHKQTDHKVCSHCWDYALKSMMQFPIFYNELEKEMMPSSSAKGERIQTSRDGSPIPVRLETLHLRTGGMSKPLMTHEATMRIQRQETKITFRGEEIHKIVKSTVYIKSHSDWAYKDYPHIDELVKEILEVYNKVQYVLGNKSDEIVIGKCPTQDEDGNVCNYKLKIDPTKLDKTSEIKCRKCETIWDSTKWRLLGRMLDAKN